MLVKIFVFVFIATVMTYGVNGEFPDDPKPCKHGDIECVSKIVNYFALEKHAGDSSINLLSFDPLDIKKLHISRGDDSPVRVDLMLTNGKGYGLKTSKFQKMTGFGKEIKGKYEIVAKADYLQLLSDYTINGQVLILPIRGQGKSNLTLIEPIITFGWIGSPEEKNGVTHMKVDKFNVDVNPKRVIFGLENLFNDKALSDNMNKFLTENSKEVFEEIRASLGHGLALVSRHVVKGFFENFPYDKVFIE